MKSPLVMTLLAVFVFLQSKPAIACREPIDKLAYASLVIDGRATCSREQGYCYIEVADIIKGEGISQDQKIRLSVDYPPLSEDPDVIIIGGCKFGWLPESGSIDGRFYLNRSFDGTFTEASSPKTKKEN